MFHLKNPLFILNRIFNHSTHTQSQHSCVSKFITYKKITYLFVHLDIGLHRTMNTHLIAHPYSKASFKERCRSKAGCRIESVWWVCLRFFLDRAWMKKRRFLYCCIIDENEPEIMLERWLIWERFVDAMAYLCLLKIIFTWVVWLKGWIAKLTQCFV